MKKQIEKFKALAVKHKWKILLVGGAIVVVGLGYLGYKKATIENLRFLKSLELPETLTSTGDSLGKEVHPDILGVGKVESLWHESNFSNIIIGDITATDLGTLGESIQKVLGNVGDMSAISAVISIPDK